MREYNPVFFSTAEEFLLVFAIFYINIEIPFEIQLNL